MQQPTAMSARQPRGVRRWLDCEPCAPPTAFNVPINCFKARPRWRNALLEFEQISAAGAEGTSLGRRVCIPLTLAFIGAGAILATTWTGGEPGEVGAAIAHELVLAIGVLATMNISGGHVDPAVTAVMVVT